MALLAKICLLGDGGVGKTSLKNRFIGLGFGTNYLPTLGSDFVTKRIKLKTSYQVNEINFQIWDLAGQPTFKQIRKIYYHSAVGALLLYDICRPETLPSLDLWIKELFINSGLPKINVVFLGNKKDLRKKGTGWISSKKAFHYIKEELMVSYAENINYSYLETSAKTGENVDKAFYSLGEKILHNFYSKDFK